MKHAEKFLETMGELLQRRRSEMTELLAKSTHERVDDQVQDSGDEALSLSMEKVKCSLEQSEIDELRLIEDALKRIDKGEFGYCIDCQTPIGEKRLKNSPYSARCIVCQEAFEG